jgi:hypothetical protein
LWSVLSRTSTFRDFFKIHNNKKPLFKLLKIPSAMLLVFTQDSSDYTIINVTLVINTT